MKMQNNFLGFAEENTPLVNQKLIELVDTISTPTNNEFTLILKQTLRRHGKRLRPLMTLMMVDGFERKINTDVIGLASIVEFVHTYSLVHDDLPSMDNDDFRNGQPTVHKTFGEGNAILVGDALLTDAFYLLTNYFFDEKISSIQSSQLVNELSLASGSMSMINGQFLDLQNNEQEKGKNTLGQLTVLYQQKTGALFAYSLLAGFILASTDDELFDSKFQEKRQLIIDFGLQLGLAYQILDDVKDIDQKSDLQKNNFSSFYSKDELTELLDRQKRQLIQRIDLFEEKIHLNGTLLKSFINEIL